MAARFVNVDRQTPMLLPPDLREWVPQDDMVHFVIEAIEGVNLPTLKINRRGSGSQQYPPKMMLSLLIYCYANGIFSSRRIERAGELDQQLQQDIKDLYVAVSRAESHSGRRYDYRPKSVTEKPPKVVKDPRLLAMQAKLRTEAGRALYALRKQTVEPVFGIIKSVMGFRRLLLRGLEKVSGEWELVRLAYNVKRLWVLKTA